MFNQDGKKEEFESGGTSKNSQLSLKDDSEEGVNQESKPMQAPNNLYVKVS
jgi:hypothetical protein